MIQMEKLMGRVSSTGGFNPYPVPKARLVVTSNNRQKKRHREEALAGIKGAHERDLDVLEKPIHSYDNDESDGGVGGGGWSMRVVRSSIQHPSAGLGVFVDGKVVAGTVLCIYPGLVYWPGTLTKEAAGDSEYIISRYDGVTIDGRHWDEKADDAMVEAAKLAMARGRDTRDAVRDCFLNPYAIGQFVNHPPPSALPNVIAVPFSFKGDMEKRFMPHQIAKERPLHMYVDDGKAGTPSLLLVASRNLGHGEELFLNYRFNPLHPYPDWYHQPFPEEAARRWSRNSIFT